MHLLKGIGQVHQVVLFLNIFRDQSLEVTRVTVEGPSYRLSQSFLSKTFCKRVDGNDSSELKRVSDIFFIFYYLYILGKRMNYLKSSAAGATDTLP